MQFGPCAPSDAVGGILAHSIKTGDLAFRKGRVLSAEDTSLLAKAGVTQVVVARLEQDDVGEDEAAALIAQALAGEEIRIGAAFTGRANLYAATDGLALIDAATVDAINRIDEALTLATLPPGTRVSARQMLATVKVIPFAVKRLALERGLEVARRNRFRIAPFVPKDAALISTRLPGMKASLLARNRTALDTRLGSLGSRVIFEETVAHETEKVAEALRSAERVGADPIFVIGASAITDRRDVIPAAITTAGGRIEHFGMPVDPGNLLLVGELRGRIVIGLPSCARSPKLNGVDFVLWRVLSNQPARAAEISRMGCGGLLTEIPTRPQPRDEPLPEGAREPRIAAIVLAAGMASRMGGRKLLALIDGKPMVRHVVDAAQASKATPVILVTGNAAEEVQSAVAVPDVTVVSNPDYSKGLSTSLRCGLKAVPADCDGAIIILADMPGVTPALIDKLIAAFNPAEDRAICVASHRGKRGNPVLWSRRFFPEMLKLEGDTGARRLLAEHADCVCEVEAANDGPLVDIDTEEALAAYRAR